MNKAQCRPHYYHSSDPIENLFIGVTVRKIADGNNDHLSKNSTSKKKMSKQSKNKTMWSQIFHWQEKAFSPQELCKYRPQKEAGFLSKLSQGLHHHPDRRIDAEYRQEIQARIKNKIKIVDQEDTVVLFTYTDKDEYIPEEALPTTSSDKLSALARDMIHLPQRHHSSSTHRHHHLSREHAHSVMYLMACVEIHPSRYDEIHPRFEMHLLCTLKYHPTRVLEVSPGFSRPTEDEDEDERDWDRGPKLMSYTFYSESGSTYEYIVENKSELTEPEEVSLVLAQAELEDQKHVREWMQHSGVTCMESSMSGSKNEIQMLYHLELLSGHDFDGQELYVQYELIVPPDEGWILHNGHGNTVSNINIHAQGTTQVAQILAKPRNPAERVAYFGYNIELHLSCDTSQRKTGKGPQVLFQVFSRDSWERHYVEGYGTFQLPVSRPGFYRREIIRTWRPRGSIRDRMSNFFIGGSNQLLDAAQVAVASDKFGFETESGGSLALRMNVLEQEPVKAPTVRSHSRRNVQDILNSLGGSKRFLSRDDARPSMAVEQFLSTLKSKTSEEIVHSNL